VRYDSGAALRPADSVLPTRTRVRREIADAARTGLALVCAPRGSGKTIALTDFASAFGAAYIRIEPGASLLDVLRMVASALAPWAPALGTSLDGIYGRASRAADPPGALAGWFARHVADKEATILIDDLHAATGDCAARFLAAVAGVGPTRITWVVGTERFDGLPAAMWLSNGTIATPIDERALRLTLPEAARLAAASAPHLTNDDIDRLHQLTRGRPAAFSFATAVARHGGLEAVLGAAAGDLADGAFALLPPAERRIAIATNGLTSLHPDAVARVCGPRGVDVLARMRRHAPYLFEGGGMRYHAAFSQRLDMERFARP
jgi:ATP/maltotriose-dependent transcriptional regulator MalT